MLSSHSQVIEQSIDLLQGLSRAEYQQVCQPLFSASIGQHMRHIIDHFDSLKRGIASTTVDYNNRSRRSETETCLATAVRHLQEVKTWLLTLSHEQLSLALNVMPEVALHQHQHQHGAQEVSQPLPVASTLARELMFCVSHAIHHYALVNIIRQLQGAQVDVNFGVAPATIAYQKSLQN